MSPFSCPHQQASATSHFLNSRTMNHEPIQLPAYIGDDLNRHSINCLASPPAPLKFSSLSPVCDRNRCRIDTEGCFRTLVLRMASTETRTELLDRANSERWYGAPSRSVGVEDAYACANSDYC